MSSPRQDFGRYRLLERIGSGGMASVYRAVLQGEKGFAKTVALKVVREELAEDEQFATMFLDEARLAATLRHPNIADVFDVGVEDGTYFFAMEYVHGQNAREVRLKAKQQAMPVPLGVGLAIASGTASALSYAHTRTGPQGALNLVHRDVSPSNILVSVDGAVKLVTTGIPIAGVSNQTWLKLAEHIREKESSKIDTVVTTDIHRLIRMNRTLHG